jgi:hypothetical protein
MSKIFDSLTVSQEVSDDVDETVKILEILEMEKIKLRNVYGSIVYTKQIDSIIKELIINVAKEYKKL